MSFETSVGLLRIAMGIGIRDIYIDEREEGVVFWAQEAGVCIQQFKIKKSSMESYERVEGEPIIWHPKMVNKLLAKLGDAQKVRVSYDANKQLVIDILSVLGLSERDLVTSIGSDTTSLKEPMKMPTKIPYKDMGTFDVDVNKFIGMVQHIASMRSQGVHGAYIETFEKGGRKLVKSYAKGDSHKSSANIECLGCRGQEKVKLSFDYLLKIPIAKGEGETVANCHIKKDFPFTLKINHNDWEYDLIIAPLVEND